MENHIKFTKIELLNTRFKQMNYSKQFLTREREDVISGK